MSLKWELFIFIYLFTGELFIMTMKKDAKLNNELTCRFKIDTSTLMNFDPSFRKSQKSAL